MNDSKLFHKSPIDRNVGNKCKQHKKKRNTHAQAKQNTKTKHMLSYARLATKADISKTQNKMIHTQNQTLSKSHAKQCQIKRKTNVKHTQTMTLNGKNKSHTINHTSKQGKAEYIKKHTIKHV